MWTNDIVLQLIELFRSHGCLWDTANNDYKNKNKKRDSWEEISKKINMPRDVTETKIHNLRSQFIRERKKVEALKKAGSSTEDVKHTTNWFAYEPLMFLIKGETTSGAMDALIEPTNKQDSQSSNMSEFETNDEIADQLLENTQDDQAAKLGKRSRKRTSEEKLNQPCNMIEAKKIKMNDKMIWDEFDIYAQYVASELRNVKSEEEVIMAKSFINEILLEARLRSISKSSTNSQILHCDHDVDRSVISLSDSNEQNENSSFQTKIEPL